MHQTARRPGRQSTEDLSASQRRTLSELREFIARHQFPPTTQELADILGISSASAHEQINQLVRKGYVTRESRKARGLTVIRSPDDNPADLVSIPILGVVAAGPQVIAEENVIGEVLVEAPLVRSGPCFALRVSGDSMIGANISDRDLVVVRQQPLAESGDIVVALVDGESTVKRLSIQGPRIELRPENAKHSTISIGPENELRICGKVIAVRRMNRPFEP